MTAQVRIAPVAPWDQGEPAIHGPSLYGAGAGRPFLYAIPVTGERPVSYSVEGLPEGLQLDPASGHITGSALQDGDTEVLLRVENRHGRSEMAFTIAIGGGLARTPPMGWNSWNAWRHWVDDARVRSAAAGLIRTGLAARGYSYVNIDSCWQGERGGRFGAIQPNSKFPDMASLSRHIHGLGLKLGIYSTPWTVPWGCTATEAAESWGGGPLIGCSSGDPDPEYRPNSLPEGRFIGIDKHEAQDVAQWVDWGFDYLKYDWNPTDARSLERVGYLVREAGRDMVLSICTTARFEDASAIKTWANMWRGLPDTDDDWPSVLKNAFYLENAMVEDWHDHIGTGSWHDLDMLALGPQSENADRCRPNRLSEDEQVTAMTAWALYPSPLLLSCDLSTLGEFELRLFGNEEVIAVNQDHLAVPCVRLREERHQSLQEPVPRSSHRVWARPLADGSIAVGLFNLGPTPEEITVDLKDLGLPGNVTMRNLWECRDLGGAAHRLSIAVPAHGAQLLRLTPG